MLWLKTLSILLEVVVAGYGLALALQKKKMIGWGIFFTFAVYVFYDAVNFFNLNAPATLKDPLFFLATISILWVAVRLYNRQEG